MAAADGIRRINEYKPFRRMRLYRFNTGISCTLAVIAFGLFIVSPMNFIFSPSNYSLNDDERRGHEIVSTLPPEASLCTTNHVAPHVGKHHLTLIGFDPSIPEWKCDMIVISSNLDKSSTLDSILSDARASGYKESQVSGSWTVYSKS
jgi:hypothetical protein